jgi:hypothetical protein
MIDNIILDDLPAYESILHAGFQLEHILVEGINSRTLSTVFIQLLGSMYETTGYPVRGLELILGDKMQPHQQVLFLFYQTFAFSRTRIHSL